MHRALSRRDFVRQLSAERLRGNFLPADSRSPDLGIGSDKEMSTIKANVAVLGGGMAGLPIASKTAYKGQKTVQPRLRQVPPSSSCSKSIPTKTMIHSAKVAHVVRTANRFGVEVGTPTVDLAAIVRRKNEVVGLTRRAAYRQVERNEGLILA